MKAILNILIGTIVIWLTGCSSPEKNLFSDCDSIKYYREYDVFSMKPLQSLNKKVITNPYVKIQYENDTAFVIYYVSNNDVLKRSFRIINSMFLRYTIYPPEPYYNFEISKVGNDSIISYLFNCMKEPSSIFELAKEDSCNCWLSSYSIDTRQNRKSYFFNDENKLLLKNISLFDYSEKDISNHSLIGSSCEKIIEQDQRFLVVFTTDCFDNNFSGNLDTMYFDKTNFPSINWVPPIK